MPAQTTSMRRCTFAAMLFLAASPALAQSHAQQGSAPAPQAQAFDAIRGPFGPPAIPPKAEDLAKLYKDMAPLSAYLGKDEADEVAFARTAAPRKIADDAEILAFDANGYHRAAAGKNGWTCLVQRSWSDNFSDPEFWNPRVRVPVCFNPAATRTVLPVYLERTQWALAKRSLAGVMAMAKTHPVPDPERGSFAIMMSKQGYATDTVGTFGPHMMVFMPNVPPETWGAGLDGVPLAAAPGDKPSITIFFFGARNWSDGSAR